MVILPHRRKGFRFPVISGGGGTDPNFSNVQLLLHFDGSDASTTFTDSSSSARTVTAVGNAQLDTAQLKYGSASGLFDGTGDRLSISASSGFDFGTSDFTIEMWARFNYVSDIQYLFDIGSNGTFVRIWSGRSVLIYATGAQVISAVIPTLSANTWYHLALVRNGNSWTFYVDGISVASGTNSRAAGSSVSGLTIGERGGGGFAFNGWLDDFRITKGVARYTANFTPPTEAFPDS